MDYKDAVKACNEGLLVTDGENTGRAKRMVILFGQDYINTDAPGRKNNFEMKKAKLV